MTDAEIINVIYFHFARSFLAAVVPVCLLWLGKKIKQAGFGKQNFDDIV